MCWILGIRLKIENQMEKREVHNELINRDGSKGAERILSREIVRKGCGLRKLCMMDKRIMEEHSW